MKKIILSAFALFALATVNAQFEIRYEGSGSDISGTIYDVNVAPGVSKSVKMWVLNTGSSNQAVFITRVHKDVPAGWIESEQICWPPSCYLMTGAPSTKATPNTNGLNGGTADATPILTTTQHSSGLVSEVNDPILGVTISELKPIVQSTSSATDTALFMYYLTADDGSYLDSIGIRFNIQSVSVDENTKLDLSISPNPTATNFTVNFDGASSADLKMVDVLGNIVLRKTITKMQTIDVSNFKNGVYFVAVSAEGRKPVVRRLIVRH